MTDLDVLLIADALPLADVLREHICGDRVARLTVSSNSMAPLLKSGDVIGLGYTDKTHIAHGRVVTFHDPGALNSLTTHRIVSSWRDNQGNLLIVTRGDHTLLFDPPWNAEAIVGQVVWRERNGRKLFFDRGPGQWLSRQLGLITERERARVSGVPLAALTLTADGIANANDQVRRRKKGAINRLVNRVSRSWRGFLTFLIPILAKPENHNEQRSTE